MASSFFFLQAEKNEKNHVFIDRLEELSDERKLQVYIIDRPLGDSKYSYAHKSSIVVLIPKHKIMFVDFSTNEDGFESYCDDFIEDLGSISDKYRYKDHIGRPRAWRNNLIVSCSVQGNEDFNVVELVDDAELTDPHSQRVCELLISLLTGSINDIDKVTVDLPDNVLDRVKKKIQLFDGDQTRFVYERNEKSPIRIQGLSGTGKTELLLHKLKETYVDNPESRIIFTCHNKILAEHMRRRIPDFFNFMKVEQQIKWDERLWCVHAWGSHGTPNSGAYRKICNFYNLPFYSYNPGITFDLVCKQAIEAIRALPEKSYAFDYMFVDESQDFPDSFFELCALVTSKTVHIAGDIFQSIFDENIVDHIEPDYLLSKCYRTDPRTLMFAHALGMGLFEQQKLRWLDDKEWDACGYLVEHDVKDGTYRLSREPLRRFEDVDSAKFQSMELMEIEGDFYSEAAESIVHAINKIRKDNPTVEPDDIGVILLDKNKMSYTLADTLEVIVPREVGWVVNKGYESKQKVKGELLITNTNNVKGLEFPFVICITSRIGGGHGYRNSLYMTLTRSFLKTYLVLSKDYNGDVLGSIEAGLNKINSDGYIEVKAPSQEEQKRIRTTIQYNRHSESFYDFVTRVFDDVDVLPIFRTPLMDAVKAIIGEDFDYENVKEIVVFNYNKMKEGY